MAKNNFKAFALDPNANVMSQADWEALPALLSGFTAGKASSAQVNKAIRQASFIASCLAQFVCDASGQDVLDDGDQAQFIMNLIAAFDSQYTGRLIKTTAIKTSQTFVKDPKMKFCRVRIVGGGGGAGGVPSTTSWGAASISGGGGAGAYAEVLLTAGAVPSSVSVIIGSGGIPQATAGADGSASSFGNIIICPGGKKSATGVLITTASSLSMGAQGSEAPTINSGVVLFSTPGSGGGYAISTAAGIIGGAGGDSFMGAGGPARYAGSGTQAGGGPGAGGAGVAIGANSIALNGGSGIDGRCIIEEYA